ncbi:NrfD/PsrC family molybdoenzyme membrane anchor subunit [Streptomyces sp. MI02-7b]|uniref:NrfD/PsrC family molybdoenzyme membrane anchor subunit n=1 Tax=Streptomyces sp. MI02-7b TaxID=462941 RepID=UPI0029B2DFFE|nr:NrfD/PsrC family molybdoenzyme membrane anchor subunit [Streptomyces sp. MI02-7b]MDX3072699.1 polysulfide reductase NrfD [Streptomyces sp. MI02-7b]
MSGDGTTPRGERGPHGDGHGDGHGGGRGGGRGRGRDDDGSREQPMVPRADFRSYYGRPVLKPPVWEWKIPAYLFTGGLSAGAALIGAGADLTGRPELRRASRIGGFGALLVSMYLLIADLGRPERFHHMLRVAKPTSPMSVGTWVLVAYGPGSALAAVAEVLPASVRATLPGRLLRRAARPAGLSAALFAPGVASYTAALLSQTAVPAWHGARQELPFVFTGSAAASGGGLGMLVAPVAEAGPARRLAVVGAAAEVVASRLIDRRPGFVTGAYTTGRPHRLRKASEYLTLGGALTALTLARRSRAAAAVGGLALLAGSALQRFGTFEAGVTSTKDPAYVVKPQRERLDARREGRDTE